MKKFLIIPFALMAFVACNSSVKTSPINQTKSDSTSTRKDASGDLYICPMDSDVHSNKPGTCTKCGMELEKKEK